MLWFSFFCLSYNCLSGALFFHMAHHANCLQFIPCPNGAQLPRIYHFILMPHLHNSTTVDKLHRTGFLTLRIQILIWSPADTKGPKSHRPRMLFLKMYCTLTVICVCVKVRVRMSASFHMHALLASVCECLKEKQYTSTLLRMERWMWILLEPEALELFYTSFVSRTYA